MRLLLACLVLWPIVAFGIEPVKIAPGVYAFIGDGGDVSPDNQGFVGNAGFIVGTAGIVVIDTGISYQFAQEMISAVEKVSQQPIRLVVLTHAAQEFIFGAAFFQARGIPILAHRRSAELMQSRCENCLSNLRHTLGEDAMRGSLVVTPEQQIDGSERVTVAGRPISIYHYGWGSTPGDLVVLDCQTRVVFAGGLVSIGRVPDLRDGDFEGWLTTLDALEKLPATFLVPGFGPPGPMAGISTTRNYLRALDRAVRTQYRNGVSLLTAPGHTPLPVFADWKQYSVLHPRNVQQHYLEVEREEFD